MSKHSIKIDDDLYDDILSYCKINNLKISEYCCGLLRKEHNKSKFCDIPFGVFSDDKENATVKCEDNTVVTNVVLNEDVKIEKKSTIEKTSESEEVNNEINIKPQKRRL